MTCVHAHAAAGCAQDDTTLVLVDLGKGRHRMGGSILAQVLQQPGGAVPDLDDPRDLVNLVAAVNALRAQGRILASTTAAMAACSRRPARSPSPAMSA